jgi:hypothetical protein
LQNLHQTTRGSGIKTSQSKELVIWKNP